MFAIFGADIIVLWVVECVLAVGSGHFRDFLGFRGFCLPCHMSFSNSQTNLNSHFLVIIIYFRFICGEKKLLKLKKFYKCFVQDCSQTSKMEVFAKIPQKALS